MKNILFWALGVAGLLVTSCQKEDLTTVSDGLEKEVTISVNLDNGVSTRAIDDFGTGTTVNRCILEVYMNAEHRYKRLLEPMSLSTGATFTLRLVTNQKYHLLAWADYVDDVNNLEDDFYYVTDLENMGLTAISPSDEVEKYVPNSDVRDGFYASQLISFTEESAYNLTLTRPFGQLNISTKMTDIDPDISYLNPKSVKVEYTTRLLSTLNALSGSTSSTIERSYTTETIETVVDEDGFMHLTTDYILAPEPSVGEYLVDFDMTFYYDEKCSNEITSKSFANIPIKRNYRTNVTGELLTESASITVDMSTDFQE